MALRKMKEGAKDIKPTISKLTTKDPTSEAVHNK